MTQDTTAFTWVEKAKKPAVPKGGRAQVPNAESPELASHLLPSAWPQNSVRNVTAVRKALEDGSLPDGTVVLCCSYQEVQQFQQLAVLRELDGKFALLTKEAPKDSGGVSASFAVTDGEGKWLETFQVFSLTKAGLPELASLLTKVAKAPQAPEVVRISVTIPRVFVPKDLWGSFKDQPSAQLKAWCDRL